MSKRHEFPAKVKLQAWERCNGHCENCGRKLYPGDFHYDHRIPDGLGGAPTLDNCDVLCRSCHVVKTKPDIRRIAKSRRVERKHVGIKKSRWRPLPGSKASGWKHKMSGEWERRS